MGAGDERLELDGDAAIVTTIGVGAETARAAEAELCRRYAPRIRLYGLRHMRDEDHARDLVQSVLLAVLQAARARRIEQPEHLDRFVLGTARNIARRQTLLDARATPLPNDALTAIAATAMPEPIDLRALLRCMSALDEQARKVVVLTFMHDRSAQEIGETLGATAGNVRVVRHRAIVALRQCIDARREEAR